MNEHIKSNDEKRSVETQIKGYKKWLTDYKKTEKLFFKRTRKLITYGKTKAIKKGERPFMMVFHSLLL